jgi:hypothetical protein
MQSTAKYAKSDRFHPGLVQPWNTEDSKVFGYIELCNDGIQLGPRCGFNLKVFAAVALRSPVI